MIHEIEMYNVLKRVDKNQNFLYELNIVVELASSVEPSSERF